MEAGHYQALCARTECDQAKALGRMMAGRETSLTGYHAPGNGHPDLVPVRVNHAVVGLAGEVGELASLVQKWLYYGRQFADDGTGTPVVPSELRAAFAEELGDVLWYAALACNALELDLGELMVANVAKLRTRYPDRYTDAAAAEENRDRAAEARAAAAADDAVGYAVSGYHGPVGYEVTVQEGADEQVLGETTRVTGSHPPHPIQPVGADPGTVAASSLGSVTIAGWPGTTRVAVPAPGFGVPVAGFHALPVGTGTVPGGTRVGYDVYGNLCLAPEPSVAPGPGVTVSDDPEADMWATAFEAAAEGGEWPRGTTAAPHGHSVRLPDGIVVSGLSPLLTGAQADAAAELIAGVFRKVPGLVPPTAAGPEPVHVEQDGHGFGHAELGGEGG